MCKGVVFSFVAFLCLGLPLAAQTGATATVLGTVTDTSSAVVAGATITATNVDTHFVRTTKTGSEGTYTVFALPIGRYSVRAEAAGFRASEVRDVQLTIDQKAQVDFQLVVGQVSETVTVTGEAPVLKTEDSSTSQVILEKAIVDLPLNGRDFMQLTRLTANVNTGDGYNITSGSVGTVIKDQGAGSVYGQRNSNNVFRLDGIQIGELTGNRSRLEPSMDAIQEFTLIKGIYPAEFGTVAGATINVAIKSGTNQLHGALFEFLRNDALDTRNFFDRTGSAPNLRRNQFGGVLGGPVIKNKTFFFGSYDGLRLRQASVSTTRVPTAPQLQGDLSSLGKTIVDPLSGTAFANAQIPASRIDPVSKALGAFWPAPNNPADPTRNFVSAFSEAVTTNQYFGRVDHRLTDKDQVFARYGHAGIEDSRPPVYPPFAIITHDTAQSAVLAETHTFSPTLLNEARFGYTRIIFTDAPLKTFPDFPIQFNLAKVTRDPAYADLPIIGVTGYTGIGSTSSTPDYSTQNNFEFVDNVMLHHGAHSFKMGMDLLRRQIFQRVPQNKKGTFTFDGNFAGDNLGDFLLGLPRQTQVGASTYISTGNLRMTNYGIYAQDDWHVSSRLTLNLGLRYEVLGAPVDIFGLSPNFDPVKADFEYAPFTKNTPIYHTDRNNFAPRFGFAYRPFNDNKTVVRGGYGIYFNANNYDEFLFLPYNPPFGNVLTYQSLPNRATLSLSNPFPDTGASAGAPAGYGMDQHLQMGYVQFFTVGVEREIARNTVLEVSYVGNKSTRLAKAVNVNFAPMGAGAVQPRRVLRQDLGNVAVVEPWSNATYHSLQVQLDRQLSQGLMLLAGYAYGKALDDVSGSTGDKGGSTAQNPYCINSCEKGPPAYDLRQRFTANVVYELPFGRNRRFLGSANHAADALLGGWDVASIISRQSGRPLTLGLPGDPLNTGNGNGRPNYLGGPTSVSNATINQWFNTAAFGAPLPYTPGNAGRGIMLGPGLFSWDFAVYKTFAFTERHHLQFRTEFFNFPNHANFGNPGTTLGTPTFGQITSAGDPRTLQFGLKYLF
ncbi:MAG TPA: TonB-dependent receptor [Bryobacterales bacterium]|nr:TonB-dependent receptor [Bryobacterales bacterium]